MQPSVRPMIATTYDGQDGVLLDRVLPYVDCLEVVPDTLRASRSGGALDAERLAELERAAAHAHILVHGVGLSIGSYEGVHEPYLDLLDNFLAAIPCLWHSEHLGFTRVDGHFLGAMLAMPRTEESLDLVSERIMSLQRRYALPFLIENVASVVPAPPGELSEAAFLNVLTQRTGCGLILDAYNLECDAHNHQLDIEAFLDELDLSQVREVHLARGVVHKGFLLDVHSDRCHPSTLELARRIVARSGAVEVVTFELLAQAVSLLGYDAIEAQLAEINKLFGRNP